MLPRWSAGISLVFVVGCSGNGFEFAPVSGKVTIDGKPAVDFHVAFEPIGSQKNPNPGPGSIGVTNAEGIFTLLSVPGKTKGAVVGKHRIRIVVQKHGADGTDEDAAVTLQNASVPFQQLPARYHDSTELTFEVPSQGTSSANFDLSWK